MNAEDTPPRARAIFVRTDGTQPLCARCLAVHCRDTEACHDLWVKLAEPGVACSGAGCGGGRACAA